MSMSEHVFVFDPPAGEERSDSWLCDLARFYGEARAREILEAPDVEIAARRRALIAEGRARDPDFVLSKADYDAAADGIWTVRIDAAGQFTVEWRKAALAPSNATAP
ncbi:MAG TPA: hypothetical protein VKG91_05130 [Roseiarcus sp.]|nr:hypothetical protein [Roseiarcus sp.]